MNHAACISRIVGTAFVIFLVADSASPLHGASAPNISSTHFALQIPLQNSGMLTPPVLAPITPNPNFIGNVTLTWSATSNASWYNVYMSKFPICNGNRSQILWEQSIWYSCSFTDYESNGTYYYAVTAATWDYYFVESNFSNCLSVVISSPARPAKPTLIPFESNITHGHEITISWSRINNVTGYRIFESRTLINSTNIGNATDFGFVPASQLNYTCYKWSNGTDYYAIEALNGWGSSMPSDCLCISVVLLVPRAPVLAPINPNPNMLDDGNVTVSWNAVNGADNYWVYVSNRPIPALINNSIIANLYYPCFCYYSKKTSYSYLASSNGQYYFVIVASNDSGSSGYSNCQAVLVNVTAPSDAPVLSMLGSNPRTSSRVTLSWTAVDNATGYRVFESTNPINESNILNSSYIGDIAAPQTTCIDQHHDNGTYYYAVVAYNVGGYSIVSNCQRVDFILSPVPMSSYIGVKPGDAFLYNAISHGDTLLSQFKASGTYHLVVVVDNVTDLGRSVVIAYHVACFNSTNNSIQTRYGTTSIDTDDIAVNFIWNPTWFINKNIADKSYSYNGTSYYIPLLVSPFQQCPPYLFVNAIQPSLWFICPSENVTWNSDGILENVTMAWNGNPNSTESYVLVGRVTPPREPRNIQATARPRSVVLSWEAPENTGGLPVIGYKIFRGITASNESLTTTIGNLTTFTDNNLTNGQRYYYTVSAINNAGYAMLSSQVAMTPFTIPSAPRDVHVASGNGQAVLSWKPPADDGGNAITGYKIYRGESPGNETLLAITDNVPVYVDTSIIDGHVYYYVIRAINSAGDGIQSGEVDAKFAVIDTTFISAIIVVAVIAGIASSYFIREKYVARKNVHVKPFFTSFGMELNSKRARLLRVPMVEGEGPLRQSSISSIDEPEHRAKLNSLYPHEIEKNGKKRCIVHMGLISVGHAETCKHCGAVFCKDCYKHLVFCDETCWKCGAVLE